MKKFGTAEEQEQARVIARRFDERYGRVDPARPVFPQAEALLSKASTVLGLDGTKMSKRDKAKAAIGMPGLTVHGLRHTSATLAAALNGSRPTRRSSSTVLST